jgi:hypothetical protein
MLKFLDSTAEIQVRNGGDTAYAKISASQFYTASKREFKTNIQPFEANALEMVNNTTIYNYQLKDEFNIYDPGTQEIIGQRDASEVDIKTGLIWDEAPEILRGEDSIDLYAMVAVLWKAVQELSVQVEQLKQQ